MTATAEIVTEAIRDALLVPDAALRFSPPGVALDPPASRDGKRVARVWVLDDGAPVAREIVPGPSDGRRTVVLEGELTEGERVIVGATRGKVAP